jgi:heptosyltransferase-2
MRTLIVAPHALGDAVMSQPLAALLKRMDPTGAIDVLASPAVAPVFDAMAEVDRVFRSHHAYGPVRPWGKFMLARRLDRHRHDRVFVLPAGKRAALVPWIMGVPIRIGLHCDTRWGLINKPHCTVHGAGARPAADPSERPAVERFAHLAFDPSEPLPGQVPNPVLTRDAEREAAALARAGLPAGTRLLVLCVSAEGGASHRWPARHWASLAAAAAEAWPELRAVLVGEAVDRAFATEVAALSGGRPLNLCGRQSLEDTLATIAQADGVVAHDCG